MTDKEDPSASPQWRCDHADGRGWGHPHPDEPSYPHACDGCCTLLTQPPDTTDTHYVVVAASHGGWGLSPEAVRLLDGLGTTSEDLAAWDQGDRRDDPRLVQVVRLLGRRAGDQAVMIDERLPLRAVEIPHGVAWQIDAYDGVEWVAERHRRWDWRGEVPPGRRVWPEDDPGTDTR